MYTGSGVLHRPRSARRPKANPREARMAPPPSEPAARSPRIRTFRKAGNVALGVSSGAKTRKQRLTSGPPAGAKDLSLREIFDEYCAWGAHSPEHKPTTLDGPKWAKLCRECGFIGPRFSITDADLVFQSARSKGGFYEAGSRQLSFAQFSNALTAVAKRLFPDEEGAVAHAKVARMVEDHGAPEAPVTEFDKRGVFTRLYASYREPDDGSVAGGAGGGGDGGGGDGGGDFGSSHTVSSTHGRKPPPFDGPPSEDPAGFLPRPLQPGEGSPLHDVFLAYCRFGDHTGEETAMDGNKWGKLCRDVGFRAPDGRRLDPAEIDLTFARVKSKASYFEVASRKITFEQFKEGLASIARHLHRDKAESASYGTICRQVELVSSPIVKGTRARTDGVYGRLTSGKPVVERPPRKQPPKSTAVTGFGPGPGSSLEAVFNDYAAFGLPPGQKALGMDNNMWAKLCRDCGLLRRGIDAAAADLAFTKAKSGASRRLNFFTFKDALLLLSEEQNGEAAREAGFNTMVRDIVEHGPPTVHATAVATTGVYGRLADQPEEEVVRKRKAPKKPKPFIVRSLHPKKGSKLHKVFLAFCAFGEHDITRAHETLDNVKWAKMTRETGLLDRHFTATDADLAWSIVKPKSPDGVEETRAMRQIDFRLFKNLLLESVRPHVQAVRIVSARACLARR